MSVMTEPVTIDELLAGLNPQQRAAATHGDGPLLIVAGAGTGKTATLVHRVAWLIARGVDPARILLLTFTRRAAAEMLRRARPAAPPAGPARARRASGAARTTPSPPACCTATARPSGSVPDFTVHDRADSEDLMNVVRTELDLAKTDKRFPKKGTCMAIYSRCVNAREKLDDVLDEHFPWCRDWQDELKRLFDGYVDRKEAAGVLDYDDLLLFWHALLDSGERPTGRGRSGCQTAPRAARQTDQSPSRRIRATRSAGCSIACWSTSTRTPTRFRPKSSTRFRREGKGLTVVGDDAQSIYAFRAATVATSSISPSITRRHDRHAGAELPQHAADPRSHEPA